MNSLSQSEANQKCCPPESRVQSPESTVEAFTESRVHSGGIYRVQSPEWRHFTGRGSKSSVLKKVPGINDTSTARKRNHSSTSQ